jgi:hypothetical protein
VLAWQTSQPPKKWQAHSLDGAHSEGAAFIVGLGTTCDSTIEYRHGHFILLGHGDYSKQRGSAKLVSQARTSLKTQLRRSVEVINSRSERRQELASQSADGIHRWLEMIGNFLIGCVLANCGSGTINHKIDESTLAEMVERVAQTGARQYCGLACHPIRCRDSHQTRLRTTATPGNWQSRALAAIVGEVRRGYTAWPWPSAGS